MSVPPEIASPKAIELLLSLRSSALNILLNAALPPPTLPGNTEFWAFAPDELAVTDEDREENSLLSSNGVSKLDV